MRCGAAQHTVVLSIATHPCAAHCTALQRTGGHCAAKRCARANRCSAVQFGAAKRCARQGDVTPGNDNLWIAQRSPFGTMMRSPYASARQLSKSHRDSQLRQRITGQRSEVGQGAAQGAGQSDFDQGTFDMSKKSAHCPGQRTAITMNRRNRTIWEHSRWPRLCSHRRLCNGAATLLQTAHVSMLKTNGTWTVRTARPNGACTRRILQVAGGGSRQLPCEC